MAEEWFDIDVHMRRVADGQTRVFRHNALRDDDEPWSPFIWEEGNFSCNCNRGQFFAGAGNEDDPNHECGDGMYLVRIVRVSDGEVLYDEQGAVMHEVECTVRRAEQ